MVLARHPNPITLLKHVARTGNIGKVSRGNVLLMSVVDSISMLGMNLSCSSNHVSTQNDLHVAEKCGHHFPLNILSFLSLVQALTNPNSFVGFAVILV
jgi:hypothetical protein